MSKKRQKVHDQGTFQTVKGTMSHNLVLENDRSCLEKRKFEEKDGILDDAVPDEVNITSRNHNSLD